MSSIAVSRNMFAECYHRWNDLLLEQPRLSITLSPQWNWKSVLSLDKKIRWNKEAVVTSFCSISDFDEVSELIGTRWICSTTRSFRHHVQIRQQVNAVLARVSFYENCHALIGLPLAEPPSTDSLPWRNRKLF